MSSRGVGTERDVDWLHLLLADLQLLADLSFADAIIWVPATDGSFVAASHARPAGVATLFYRDFVGQNIKAEWRAQVTEAYEAGVIVDSTAPAWFEEVPTRVRTVPVVRPVPEGTDEIQQGPIAVVSLHTNLSQMRQPSSRQQKTFNECADDLFVMMSTGNFPDIDQAPAPRRGAPRASDGLLRMDVDGVVNFASPNAISAFSRIGYREELEGELLAEVAAQVLSGKLDVDESLPVVVSGRAPWRADIENRGVTVSLRTIPLEIGDERTGALVLCRDVTEMRHQERELMTKDATIREIHHRVKNNLQTVASLLRIQARRTTSDETREALARAMRRVASIAVVHDTLSSGLNQNVDFDEVFQRVLMLSAEVASLNHNPVKPQTAGSFGVLPSEYATPLALALTEIVTNAVEHGFDGSSEGAVDIRATRTNDTLHVEIDDNGKGIGDDGIGDGLGTQIVRTLVEGELSGTITWEQRTEGGTRVVIEIPLRFLDG
jgi:two-component sensor histidine kinase